MTHDDLLSLDRRALLRVALATLPAAALPGGPLSVLWPAGERDREVDEPYLLCKDGMSIWDPSQEVHCAAPTLRELLECGHDRAFGHAGGDELDGLLEDYVDQSELVDPDDDAEALDARVRELRALFDEPADLDVRGGFHDMWLDVEGNRAAHDTWDEFPVEELERAGLRFVEGDRPGSSYTSIVYRGSVDELNGALAREGLNIVVEERPKGG